MDILLQKFFEAHRWEQALETGVDKHIDKGELRKLTSPEVRLAMYNAIISDNYEIAPPHQAQIPKDNGDMRIVMSMKMLTVSSCLLRTIFSSNCFLNLCIKVASLISLELAVAKLFRKFQERWLR